MSAPESPTFTNRKAGAPSVQFSAPQVNTLLGTLGLSPNPLRGLGVTVAVIDSGIYPSEAFGHRIKAFYDFTDGGVRSSHAFDDYGHGTHVAGLIGGNQVLSDNRFEGVAPGVQFVALKVLDKTGSGRTSDVIRAIEFAIANRAVYGIDVINLSLGHPIFEPAASDPLVSTTSSGSGEGGVGSTSTTAPVLHARKASRSCSVQDAGGSFFVTAHVTDCPSRRSRSSSPRDLPSRMTRSKKERACRYARAGDGFHFSLTS